MCVKYYAVSVEKSSINEETKIVVKNEITKEEFENLFRVANFLKDIMPAKEAHRIVIRNGRELLYFLSDKNLKDQLLIKKCNKRNFITDANRLTFNFCASMRTFVDYAKTAVKRKGEEKDFKNIISQIFDESLEYRFFEKLRNYIIHYSYPFIGIEMSAPDFVKIVCRKEYLQEYDGWGAIVKKDLLSMPEEIDVRQYIEPLLVRLETIHMMMYYYYAQDYCTASTAFASFQKKYHLKEPATMCIEGDLEGKITIHPLSLEAIAEGLEQLKHNPYVNLVCTDK